MEFVRENDVKFIRLGYCDLFGFQKNVSIMADELKYAFESGISFDANAVKGFQNVTSSDLLLFPDADTLTVLPWRPGTGRVARFYCDIKNPDGKPFAYDGRHILKRVTEQYKQRGFTCKIGTECEFYLFKTDEHGEPTLQTFDKGGYMDISPLDKGENIRREICITLEEMEIIPEASHHEQGPGQNEIDFKFSDALSSADNLLTFKAVVKSAAARNGLFASFMPKPIADAPGSGLHVNLSLSQNGQNIFANDNTGKHAITAQSFIAGILAKTPEITLFLNPIINSYARFGAFEAPKYISWSHQNRSQLVRIPAATGEKARMELRSPDPAINPYLAFALILAAGLSGIENNMYLPDAVNADLYNAGKDVVGGLRKLPECLDDSIELARNSMLVHSVVGGELLSKYIDEKQAELHAYSLASNKDAFIREMYFSTI